MVMECTPCIYILASGYNGSLYVGVTSNLVGRVAQHRAGTFGGHTRRYGIYRLVYFEIADTMDAAIAREKQLKRYRRDWKRNLIEREKPAWNDLGTMFGLEPLTPPPAARWTPAQGRGDGNRSIVELITKRGGRLRDRPLGRHRNPEGLRSRSHIARCR